MKKIIQDNQLILELERSKRVVLVIIALFLFGVGVTIVLLAEKMLLRIISLPFFSALALAVFLLSQDRKQIVFDKSTHECIYSKTTLGIIKKPIRISFSDIDGFILERRHHLDLDVGPTPRQTFYLLLKNRSGRNLLLDMDDREDHIRKHAIDISSFIGMPPVGTLEEKSDFSSMRFDY